MRTLAAAALVVFFLSASLSGWRILSRSDTYVVGGELDIAAGQVVNEDLHVIFAQVKLADGARIEGRITAVSSTLDLAGSVRGPILTVQSDVTVRSTAQLAQDPQNRAGIPFVLLLPRMLRTGSAISATN